MKILMVHNYYQQEGGEDKSFEAEATVLQENGHEVIRIVRHNDTIPYKNAFTLGSEALWNHSIYQEVRSTIRSHHPDIVHCHNIFPLISPSVYFAAKAEHVPVVQSLSNYRLFCAKGIFFRKGRICEACFRKAIPWPGLRHACYRHSYSATAVTTLIMWIHRQLGMWSNMVDTYITFTEFARQKFIEGGLPADRIIVKPVFLSHDPLMGRGQKKYALFVGRLTPEKGIRTLLKAWEQLGAKIPLRILVDGMLAEEVQRAAAQYEYVEWLGNRSLQEVYAQMGEAAFLVFPSEWYETFGRVAMESFAKGTPVLAADIGAVGEVTRNGLTGLHFRPGDVADLVEKVEWLLSHPAELSAMRKRARIEYETKYSAELNYELTMALYEDVVAGNTLRFGSRVVSSI